MKDIEGNSIDIDKYDQGSRSLLNRNALGEYKFSHKSILEYFLAKEVVGNINFRKNFRFESNLDTAKKFFLEIIRFEADSKSVLVEERLKEFNLAKLGFAPNEIISFLSKDYVGKSFEGVINIIYKSIVKESFAFLSVSTGFLCGILYFVKHEVYLAGGLLRNTSFYIIIINTVSILFFYIRKYRKLKASLALKGEEGSAN